MLASGATIPIASLRPGDRVLATNTRSGKTQAEPVTAVLIHHDTNRYDLTIEAGRNTTVVQTTSTHLFGNPAAQDWIKAAALGHGARLQTPGSTKATVLGGYSPKERAGWMWDLTIAGDHDFYIYAAANIAILAHNCAMSEAERLAARVDEIHGAPRQS